MAGARDGVSQAVGKLGGDLDRALGEVRVPAAVIDAEGVIRWQNDAITERFGDLTGRRFTKLLAPESVNEGRTAFARKLLGVERTSDRRATFLTRAGERIHVDVSTVVLEGSDHRAVGIFGLASPQTPARKLQPLRQGLTPRETEVLYYLSEGYSTQQIVDQMGIAKETVRNFVRFVLRKLQVHSRLEAVAEARRRGLLD